MTDAGAFRLHEEKHVSAEVERMVWSPKMDLLAIATVQGEVVLHRLSWQKVWTLAAPSEDIKVTAIAWRPDGKVLAVGYSSGKVIICDVENATPLHDLQFDTSLTSMSWTSEMKPEVKDEGVAGDKEGEACYHDQSSLFLPRLPHFPKNYSSLSKTQGEDNVEDTKRLKGQTDLNILVAGTEGGQLWMFVYGVFPVGVIELAQHATRKTGKVLSGHISSDLRLLSLIVEGEANERGVREVFTISFDTSLLASRDRELQILALKFGQVLTLMTYVASTIQQMGEAWEDILMEMDSKLLKFAEEKRKTAGGCVSNDFLRLLIMGTPSDELQAFLLHDLTDKGLKKLGHSIESSYTNIQKLVLKHLQSVGQALVYQLSDIRGMALWYDKFGVLGLSAEPVQQAIAVAGTFMLKASELQQVIDRSMKNFKAFFRWLYVLIKTLSDEQVPQELSKMTQQDLNFVAQFLKENFTEETNSESGFKLEKVGQYLVDEDLVDPPDQSANPWVSFLQQNPTIKDSGLLYDALPSKSLLQVCKMLQTSINTALNKCSGVIGGSLQCVLTGSLFPIPEADKQYPFRISQYSKCIGDETYMYTAFTADPLPCTTCHVLRHSTTDHSWVEMVTLDFREGPTDSDPESRSILNTSSSDPPRTILTTHRILDVAFYDADTLSVILEEEAEATPILVQLPVSMLHPHMMSVSTTTIALMTQTLVNNPDIKHIHIDMPAHEGLMMRRLENMRASAFAVSGTRKVACVLFSSRRRVRLFIMDAEDEEEDEEEEENQDTGAEVSHVTTDGQALTDEDEDKENSRESGAMDM